MLTLHLPAALALEHLSITQMVITQSNAAVLYDLWPGTRDLLSGERHVVSPPRLEEQL